MKKNGRTYRVMIIPEQNGVKTVSFQMSSIWVTVFVAGFAAIMGVSIFLMYKSVQVSRKLNYYNALQSDNERLAKENKQLSLAYHKIAYLDSIAAYLEQLSSLTQPPAKKVVATRYATELKPATTTENSAVSQDNQSPSILPVDGWITQRFTKESSLGDKEHPGIDIAAPAGMVIKAPAPGIVTAILQDADYGTMVVLEHEGGIKTRYGHCAKAMVAVNDKIIRGQVIALVGNTGHSSAPHLHYEVIKNGINDDPLRYITPKGKTVN